MPRTSIIITGGASGIGQALATHFASSSSSSTAETPNTTNNTTSTTHISILDINPTTGEETLDSLRAQYPTANLSFHHCDVTSWDSQAAAFYEVYKAQGRIDFVFANAGVTEKGSLLPSPGETVPTKPDLRTVEANFLGVLFSVKLAIFYLMKNALPETKNTNPSRGAIICTASSAGLYGFSVAPVYSATKHGVIGLVRSMERYLAREGIRINALAPAVIETNIAPDKDLFKHMSITPMSTAIRAARMFVDDPELTGKVAELHGEHVTFAEQKEYADASVGENIEVFWKLGYA